MKKEEIPNASLPSALGDFMFSVYENTTAERRNETVNKITMQNFKTLGFGRKSIMGTIAHLEKLIKGKNHPQQSIKGEED